MTLIITDEDMAIFDQLVQQRFIDELYHYCKSSFPSWTKKTKKEHVITILDGLIDTAKKQQFENRGSIYLFLNISLRLGGLFYEDNQYVRLTTEFKQNSYRSENVRIDLLYQGIMDYSAKVEGDDDIFIKTALRHLGTIKEFHIKENNFMHDMLDILAFFYPEKFDFVGKSCYQQFIEQGQQKALSTYCLTSTSQQVTFILLQFFLGEHFDHDPFLSWFDWPTQLIEINHNRFNFKSFSEQLLTIKELKINEMEAENG